MNEAAALPSPTVLLSARLDRYYGRLRHPPGTPSISRRKPVIGRDHSDDDSQAAGPGRASPVPIATFSTFHAPYAGRSSGLQSRIYTPSMAFAVNTAARLLLTPRKRRAPNDAAGFA
jgi:hypothetical protein